MPKFAANLSLLFTEYAFPERFYAAKKAGFQGIECQFPYEYPAALLAEKLHEQQLECVLFNLPAGDWANGERGIACLPERQAEFRAGVDVALEYARQLQCPRLNCLAGKKPATLARSIAEQVLCDNVRYAADKLADAGVQLVIEAINTTDIPDFLLHASAQVAEMMTRIDHPNVRYQYDVYHMQIMEGNLTANLVRYLPLIGHIQVADNPGRHEPGSGEINYRFLFQQIDRLGFDGWIGCEYLPLNGTEAGLGWLHSL